MNDSSQTNDLYILHLNGKIANHAQHYVGYTTLGVNERIKRHRSGDGAKMIAHALRIGLDFQIGHLEHFATAEEARYREIRLKREKNLARHCDICRRKNGQGT
jgi:predicted GIY-YIG superfamily endonuclease